MNGGHCVAALGLAERYGCHWGGRGEMHSEESEDEQS